MSNPELKAKELVDKFKSHSYYDAHDLTTRTQRNRSNVESAIECALICVDEIIASRPEPWIRGNAEWENEYLLLPDNTHVDAVKYWQDVKKQLL